METFRVTPWQGAPSPTQYDVQEKIRAEDLRGYIWSNRPLDEYAAHTHSFGKIVYVLAGSIVWLLPETGQKVETFAGDRIDLPRETMHAAQVGADGVVCFEAHVG